MPKILSSHFKFIAVFLFLLTQPAFAFNELPTETFDSVGYISTSSSNISGEIEEDEMMQEGQEMKEAKFDRSVRDVSFSFSPTRRFGFTIDHYTAKLNETDTQYEMPAGPKKTPKKAYERTSVGVRSMIINNQSTVKVGVLNEIIMNNTADQDGEAFSITPFFYLGHHLPFSVRYAYNVEASRRKTRELDSDLTSTDRFYGSHFYIRISPYHSVARLPFGYEYYQRNGTAPDLINFDTEKDRTIEHRIFFHLPARMQLTLTVQDNDGVDSVGLGLDVPFF